LAVQRGTNHRQASNYVSVHFRRNIQARVGLGGQFFTFWCSGIKLKFYRSTHKWRMYLKNHKTINIGTDKMLYCSNVESIPSSQVPNFPTKLSTPKCCRRHFVSYEWQWKSLGNRGRWFFIPWFLGQLDRPLVHHIQLKNHHGTQSFSFYTNEFCKNKKNKKWMTM
jgi:hypothetical protein